METMESVVISDPKKIYMVQLLTQRAALKLELAGMRHSSGRSMSAHLKRTYGFKGNKQAVYAQFCEYVEKQKELYGEGT